MSTDEQKSLFGLNLKMVDAKVTEQFVDGLNKLEWQSLLRHRFIYNENDDMKFTYLSLSIRCDRRFKKNDE